MANLMDNERYAKAYATVTEASKAHTAAVKAYRAQTIGDTEFLAAVAVYKAAEDVYEAEYALACEWAENQPEEVPTFEDNQISLF